MITLASIVDVIEAMDPTYGGYRMDVTDSWVVDVDSSTRTTIRPFLCRIFPGSGSYDGSHRLDLSIEWATPRWTGTKTFDGLTPLYAYDVARMSAMHLAERMASSFPGSSSNWTIEEASTDGARADFLLVSLTITLHTERGSP